jgi:hypothetical protein
LNFACGADNGGHQRDDEHDQLQAGPGGVAHVEAPPVAGVFILCLSIMCTVTLQPWYQICVYPSVMHYLVVEMSIYLHDGLVCKRDV